MSLELIQEMYLTDKWTVVDFRPPKQGDHYVTTENQPKFGGAILECAHSWYEQPPRLIVEKKKVAS